MYSEFYSHCYTTVPVFIDIGEMRVLTYLEVVKPLHACSLHMNVLAV